MKKLSAENITPTDLERHDGLINDISQTYDKPQEALILIHRALKKFDPKNVEAFFATEKAALESRKKMGVNKKRTVRELLYALDPKVNFIGDQAMRLKPGGPTIGQSARAESLD